MQTIRSLSLSALGLLAGAPLLGACAGSNDAPADAASTDEIASAADAFCPQGFAFDAASQLCLSPAEAAGPFPPSMVAFCRQWVADRADGSNACQTNDAGLPATRWERTLAVDARQVTRGADGCAQGTTLDPKQGYCSDGKDLYGPFSKSDVAFCQAAGGGAACETNRVAVGMVQPKSSGPASGGFNAAGEIAVNGALWGKLVVAVGHAEGTLTATGGKTQAYFGHDGSGLHNIGLWSCVVCGDRSAPAADQYYYDTFIKPEVSRYTQAAGPLANHPMVAAAFFGLLVQSPAAALEDADADDLAFVTLLGRGQLAAPVTETKLLDLLVRSWTVNGTMLWRNPDTGQYDAMRGRQDQLRRLQAYAASLSAQGVNPYPTSTTGPAPDPNPNPGGNPIASFAGSYDRARAVSYAHANWNNNDGELCQGFVSNALSAGGLNVRGFGVPNDDWVPDVYKFVWAAKSVPFDEHSPGSTAPVRACPGDVVVYSNSIGSNFCRPDLNGNDVIRNCGHTGIIVRGGNGVGSILANHHNGSNQNTALNRILDGTQVGLTARNYSTLRVYHLSNCEFY
jgi:hypothetical protein